MAARKTPRIVPKLNRFGLSEIDYERAVAIAKEHGVTIEEAARCMRIHRAASKGECADYKGE